MAQEPRRTIELPARSPVRVVALKNPGASGPSHPAALNPAAPQLGLADLVDRASVQLMILRRTLDEATALGNAARLERDALGTQLVQSQQAKAELDASVERSGAAISVLDRASESVRSLEEVLGRIRGLREAVARQLDEHARQQREAMETRLARAEQEWAARLARLESLVGERIRDAERDLPARVGQVESAAVVEIERARQELRTHAAEADRAAEESARRLKAEHDRLGAALDRQCAQAQARVSLLVDQAQEKLSDAERRGEALARSAGEQVRRLDGANERAGDAAAVLEDALTRSDGRALLLERCMTDATRQAESMLVVARDLTKLIDQADRSAAGAGGDHAGKPPTTPVLRNAA